MISQFDIPYISYCKFMTNGIRRLKPANAAAYIFSIHAAHIEEIYLLSAGYETEARDYA